MTPGATAGAEDADFVEAVGTISCGIGLAFGADAALAACSDAAADPAGFAEAVSRRDDPAPAVRFSAGSAVGRRSSAADSFIPLESSTTGIGGCTAEEAAAVADSVCATEVLETASAATTGTAAAGGATTGATGAEAAVTCDDCSAPCCR